MSIHKELSINLWAKLKFFANTHGTSIWQISSNSNAWFGL